MSVPFVRLSGWRDWESGCWLIGFVQHQPTPVLRRHMVQPPCQFAHDLARRDVISNQRLTQPRAGRDDECGWPGSM